MSWFKMETVRCRWRLIASAMAILLGLTVSLAQANPPMNWGHYAYDEGTTGSWYKPIGCQQAKIKFTAVVNPDSGYPFGIQAAGPGPYPQMYTYQNNAYFLYADFKNDYCQGAQGFWYTIRTDPGMGKPGTTFYESTHPITCTYVNNGAEQGYNCYLTVNAGETGWIRTKHYTGFGNNARWTFAHITLRPDWGGAIYHWMNWGYSQVTGP